MAQRIYVGTKPFFRDALGEKTRTRIIHDLNIGTITAIRTAALYAINGVLSPKELGLVAAGPLSDPVIQDFTIDKTYYEKFDWMVEVCFRPGVTDNPGRTAREAVAVTLKRELPDDFSVHTGTQYFIDGMLPRKRVEHIAGAMLANELIQSVTVYSRDEWMHAHQGDFPAPVVQSAADEPPPFRVIDINIDDAQLMKISREGMLALTIDEMRVVKAHFASAEVRAERTKAGMPANPTDVELEIIAQTWSEHCKHKIFAAKITYHDGDTSVQTIGSLFKDFIQRTTKDVRAAKGGKDICLSVFKDDAGIIRFSAAQAIAFKVETHNSPSALDPYGGALTGIVGVNRDSFAAGMGGKLIGNTDVFCFASPNWEGKIPPRLLHPKRIFEGVREGVEHGGNKSGIPTVNGTIVFDDRFLGKPLVFCGTLSIMPMEVAGRCGYEKQAMPGDHIFMVGGRIGKDGIHGATFSSEPLHEGSPATAVQIGDPITQKRATDFLLRARDKGLYNAMTDNGAGGLSSSVGEMGKQTGGATVHVDRAPVKYHGLAPWEIIVSEAQERFTLAVPPQNVAAFIALAKEWSVEATDLGEFNDSGYFTVVSHGTVAGRLGMEFLHDGLPKMELVARWNPPQIADTPVPAAADLRGDLLALMKRLNICSKEYVVRQYDHEVQGGSVVKPLVGARNDGPGDAAVIRPVLDSDEGIVVSNGIVPRYSDIDTYAMTVSAIDEAVRNAVCVGADPDHMAGLDNFCWCDPLPGPDNPEAQYKLAQLVRSNQALYDLCTAYGIPLISGKDSMKNDYRVGDTKISIPPTILFSLVAKIADVRTAVTMDLKEAGNPVYVIGTTRSELGASEYASLKGATFAAVPRVHAPAESLAAYRALHAAMGKGLVRAAHDCSDGGLAAALAEMSFAGEMGLDIDLSGLPQKGCRTDVELLFSESQCRIIVEVKKDQAKAFESAMGKSTIGRIGTVTRGDMLTVKGLGGAVVLSVSRVDLKAAWKSTLNF